MCGLTGFIDIAGGDAATQARVLRRMTQTLHHRGPDDGDIWLDSARGVGLGHRRLAIVDLSPAGHQPMKSASGNSVLVYNGELYNTAELAQDIEAAGVRLRGHSDSEVLVEACDLWGVERTLERLNGMFAFALWQRDERRLWLARDRVGIKPLYWGQFGTLLLFGSELKALRAHPGWQPRLDTRAVAAYLELAYIPSPLSIYEGVYKLEPGHLLQFDPGGSPCDRVWWDLRAIWTEGQRQQRDVDDAGLIDELEHLLGDAVRRQMVSDVPLGSFLSGGIDSSTVTALMQAHSDRPVSTFSIGFHEAAYDEALHARAVARHLGTAHQEVYVTPDDARAIIPDLPDIYDEPFSDSSQIPTFLVSRLARSGLVVALTGDGGDELFAGYNRYTWVERLWRLSGRVPAGLRRMGAAIVQALPVSLLDAAGKLLPAACRPPLLGDKIHKAAELASHRTPDGMYRQLVGHWSPGEVLAAGITAPSSVLDDEKLSVEIPALLARLQFLDLVTYLPGDILTKVDRASMAVSLETRVPLLDHRVVEFAARLPPEMRVRNARGKWLLRAVLRRHVPDNLIERPKMGFGVPIDAWLRGPLRGWANELLQRLTAGDALIRRAPVMRCWNEHLAGRRNHQYRIWNLLMLQAWRERWGL